MKRPNRNPLSGFYRAMENQEYPIVESYGTDSPSRLYGVAGFRDYIARLESDRSLNTHLPKSLIRGVGIEAITRASDRNPERNEDAYYTLEHNGALAIGVLDGLGGLPGSEYAARAAAAVSHNFVKQHITQHMRPGDSTLVLAESLQFANAAVALENRRHGLYSDLATTAALASLHIHPDNSGRQYAALAWIGDSRIYHNRDGQVLYTSLDDSGTSYRRHAHHTKRSVQDFLERTSDSDEDFEDRWDDPVLGDAFMFRNMVGECLDGKNNRLINIATLEVIPGDTIYALTDGITDNLTRSEIAEMTNVKDLLSASLARSRDEDHPRSKPDDMTAAMIQV